MATRLVVPVGGTPYVETFDPTLEPGYTPPPDPSTLPYILAKTTPWKRMTTDEAAAIYAAMEVTDAQLRGIYDAAQYINSADPLFSTLHDMIATTLGSSSRADELLARET